MAKKKAIKSKEEPKIAEEPLAIYGANRLQFFNSFEEMEQADAKEMALLSSIEHLQNVTALIKRVFTQELKKEITDLKIYYK